MLTFLCILWFTVVIRLCFSLCLHDAVQRDTQVVSPPDAFTHTRRIVSRATTWAPHLPVRVTPWYLPGESALLTPPQVSQLQTAIKEVTEIISSMLSVRRWEGPLLLNRNMNRYCRSVWGDPSLPNYKRCGSQDSSYYGERCLDVLIPESHLYGYEVWSMNGTEPILQIPDGTGVADTDFLLYVRVAQTKKCALQPVVIAYASYCQLEHTGRPIAGVIVFCPKRLREGVYQHHHIVQVSLHEILHALGFSSSLFEKWIDCSFSEYGDVCSSRSRVTNTDENGQFRIYTPTVMQRMGEHLGVGSTGAPLENQEKSASSHWESRIMQGSIMTASINPPHLTFLDPITLAAFQDMGWYKVNSSISHQLVWGRGAGNSFGLPFTCHKPSDFFCENKSSDIGCHHLHLDKGNCSTDTFLDGCYIYKPLAHGGECWLEKDNAGSEEIYHLQSRCFYSNLTQFSEAVKQEKVKGRCYLHRCLGPNTFQVKVQGSEWTDCPAGEWIHMPGFDGVLLCPDGRLCLGLEKPPLPPSTSATTLTSSIYKPATHRDIRVQVTLMDGFKWTSEMKTILMDEILGIIAHHAGVQRCLLHVSSVANSDLTFTITPEEPSKCPPPASQTPLHELLMNLTDPITYESPQFSYVIIRLLESDSYHYLMNQAALIGGCTCGLLCVLLIISLIWCRQKLRNMQVRDIYNVDDKNIQEDHVAAAV
ncbi:ciliated left-right organizer metallopeptidase [Pyxicephalus adspersus]|uniref:ciliated left-right organizer metallopeptidase n=1 Tax=Pyxicephalus adspersus TaxID=30357 RepID=UPI003B58F45B